MSRRFFIAGVQFRPNAAKVLSELEVGTELELELEPTNKYDPNAIKIMYEDEHVGYVPKKFSAEITAMIEVDGIDCVQCVISQINPEAKQWGLCEVEILSLAEDSEPVEEPDVDEIQENEDFAHDNMLEPED